MQILARIPVLPTAAEPADCCTGTQAGTQRVAGDRDAGSAHDRPGLEVPATDTVAAAATAEPVVKIADENEERAPAEPVAPVGCRDARVRPVEPTRSSLLPAPSILMLTILAVAMWVAALRNDRLRLDAARQARAERMAQVVPDAVNPRGSRTR